MTFNSISEGKYMRFLYILFFLITFNYSWVFAQERPPARVVVSKISLQEVAPNRSFIGTLYYERISHISSEFPGLVTRVNVMTGDRIKMGTPVVKLDTEVLEKEILIRQNLIDQANLHMEK